MTTKGDSGKSGARAQGVFGAGSPLGLGHLLKREDSPLNGPVWKAFVRVAAGSLAAWILVLVGASTSTLGILFVAAASGFAWFEAVRLLLRETKLKKFWVVWLGTSLFFVILFDHSKYVWITGVVFAFVFLLFRKYAPYRHLSSKRRALVFLMSSAAFILLTIFWRFSYPGLELAAAELTTGGSPPGFGFVPSLGLNIAGTCSWSLRFFFAFSLLSLFLRVRLHFLKIKPKLAVSALLLIMVPVFLLLIMEIVVLYSVLGESRAVRASAILRDWTEMSSQNPGLLDVLSGEPFLLRRTGEEVETSGPPPPWIEGFRKEAAENPAALAALISSRTGFFLWHESSLWVVTKEGPLSGDFVLRAARIGQRMMDRLAAITRSEVIISVSNPINITRIAGVQIRDADVVATPGEELRGSPPVPQGAGENQAPASSGSLWKQRFYFGMTHLDVVGLGPAGFERFSVLLSLKSSVSDIISEVFSANNPLGVAFVVGILTTAGLMLVFEIFALVFGLRVVGGMTSAIKALHSGAKRIAAGDLEAKTKIPNEDELGDLALAFNEMTSAVKRGREEAIAREKLERELKVAREIQERLLPHIMPEVPGFEISGTSLPSQQVSGDYFDFLDMESGRVGIAIADVSGKGIPAALLMANLQASLHGQAVETGEASKVVGKINDLLARSTDAFMFATFFYGVLDRQASSFTYTNAGHNPPFVFHQDGTFERLDPSGILIGFMAKQEYRQRTLALEPGDVVVLFTDGITEAVHPGAPTAELKYFGEERLVDVIRDHLALGAGEIQSAILGALVSHMGGAAASDDITLVVIKRRVGGDPPAPPPGNGP